MLGVMCSHVSMKEEEVPEHMNAKTSVTYVHFRQLVDHCCNVGMHLITLI